MNQEQLERYAPLAQAFGDAVVRDGHGFAVLRFEKAVVVVMVDGVPGSDKLMTTLHEISAWIPNIAGTTNGWKVQA